MPSPKILIIESDPAAVQELIGQLSAFDVEVVTCSDPQQAVESVAASQPQLVLLRIELPRISGYSICNRLKKDAALRQIPLVVVSSNASPETFEQHKRLKTRAEAYLQKPFSVEELITLIGPLVDLRPLVTATPGGEGELDVDLDGVELRLDSEQFEAFPVAEEDQGHVAGEDLDIAGLLAEDPNLLPAFSEDDELDLALDRALLGEAPVAPLAQPEPGYDEDAPTQVRSRSQFESLRRADALGLVVEDLDIPEGGFQLEDEVDLGEVLPPEALPLGEEDLSAGEDSDPLAGLDFGQLGQDGLPEEELVAADFAAEAFGEEAADAEAYYATGEGDEAAEEESAVLDELIVEEIAAEEAELEVDELDDLGEGFIDEDAAALDRLRGGGMAPPPPPAASGARLAASLAPPPLPPSSLYALRGGSAEGARGGTGAHRPEIPPLPAVDDLTPPLSLLPWMETVRQRLEDAEGERDLLQIELNTLTGRAQDLERDRGGLAQRLSEVARHADLLRQESEKAEAQRLELETELVALQAEYAQLEQRLGTTEQEAQASAEEVGEQLRELKRRLEAKEAEVVGLTDVAASGQADAEAAAAALQEELAVVQASLQEREQALAEIQQQRQEESEEVAQLRAQLEGALGTLASLQEESAGLQQELASAQEALLATQVEQGALLAAAQEECATLKQQVAQQSSLAATSQEAAAEQQLRLVQEQEEERAAWELERHDLEERLAAAQAEFEAGEAAQASLAAELVGLQEQLTQAYQQTELLQQQLAAAQQEHQELTAQRDDLLGREQGLQAERDELFVLQESLAAQLAELQEQQGLGEAQLQEQAAALQAAAEERAGLVAQLDESHQGHSGALEEVTRLLGVVAVLEAARDEGTSQLQQALSTFELEKAALEEQVGDLTGQLGEAQAELAQQRADLAQRQEELAQRQEELGAAQAASTAARDEAQATAEQLAAAQQQLAGAEEERQRQEARLADQDGLLQQALAERDALTVELERLTDENLRWAEAYQTLEQELATQQEAHQEQLVALTQQQGELEARSAKNEERVLRAYQKLKSDEKVRDKVVKALRIALSLLAEQQQPTAKAAGTVERTMSEELQAALPPPIVPEPEDAGELPPPEEEVEA